MKTNKEKVLLNASKDLIPDAGLGEFLEGYSSQRDPFNYKLLLWILVPVIGWSLVLVFIVNFFFHKWLDTKDYIYLYKEGFLWVRKPCLGNPRETIVRFDEIGGIRYSKTRHYKVIYLVNVYNETSTTFEVCDRKGLSICKVESAYRNEKEADDKYNAVAFASNAIIDRWNEMAIERFNRDVAEKGYGTFYTKGGTASVKVELGRDFIKTGNHYAGSEFRYAFQDGLLYIYPTEEDRNFSDKTQYFTINVNEMYDSRIFLLAAAQYLGIK